MLEAELKLPCSPAHALNCSLNCFLLWCSIIWYVKMHSKVYLHGLLHLLQCIITIFVPKYFCVLNSTSSDVNIMSPDFIFYLYLLHVRFYFLSFWHVVLCETLVNTIQVEFGFLNQQRTFTTFVKVFVFSGFVHLLRLTKLIVMSFSYYNLPLII